MSKTQHALIIIDPLTEIQKVQINVGPGTIWCTPNSGALRVAPRTLVSWTCNHAFSISFQQIGGVNAPLPTLESEGPADGSQSVQLKPPPVPEAVQAPYYEYTVRVGSLAVDPIIIVDK